MIGEQGRREQAGVGCSGRAYRKRRDRHASRHLHDREQGIQPVERFALHRHTEHRHRGLGGEHAGQVRSTAGAGDDSAQATRRGGFGVVVKKIRRAVRRHHAHFMRHAELFEPGNGVLHGLPIAAGSHHDPDQGQNCVRAHGVLAHGKACVQNAILDATSGWHDPMDRKLLDILCCPTTKQPLALLNSTELAAVNRAIVAGGLSRGDGQAVLAPIAEGLITRDQKTVYRVEDGIPVLLADEAIATATIVDFPR